MKKKWSQYPRTKDPVIRLLRNSLTEVHDGTHLYKKGPFFKDWTVSGVLYWVWEHGTEEQHRELNRMHEIAMEAKIPLAFAYVIQEYIYKYDRRWLENNRHIFDFLFRKDWEHIFE